MNNKSLKNKNLSIIDRVRGKIDTIVLILLVLYILALAIKTGHVAYTEYCREHPPAAAGQNH
jgi:hypothetical protein